MKDFVSLVEDKFIEKKEFPKFSTGDTITVYYEIREGEKVSQCSPAYTLLLRDHSSITSAKTWVGGVRKWQFLLIYSTIFADAGGWA